MSGTLPTPPAQPTWTRALEDVPARLAEGFTTFCVKPSQFTDDPADVGRLCRDVVARVAALAT